MDETPTRRIELTEYPTSQLLETTPIVEKPTESPTQAFPSVIPAQRTQSEEYLDSCKKNQSTVLSINKIDYSSGFLFIENQGKVQLLEEDYRPVTWSPSGRKLLVSHIAEQEYGIADWDGSNIHILPQPNQGHICKAAWLTETELLVSVCTNEGHPLYDDDMTYILDISTGRYIKIGKDEIRKLQAISPKGDLWIEKSDHMYFVRENGTEEIADYLPDSSDNVFPLDLPSLVFSPDGDILYFIKVTPQKVNILYELYDSTIQNQSLQPEQLLYSGFLGTNYLMKISPDGKFMAVIISSTDLYILNLTTKQVDYQWDWPDPRSWPPIFTWAPDSARIGFMSFDDSDKIQILDIETGKINTLLTDEGPMRILDWRCIQSNP